MRLFVAVWLPERAVAALAALPRSTVPGVRWTTPGQWHVTLAYLGDVSDDALGGFERALAAAAAGATPTPALLGPATVRLGRTVLCVPVEGLDDLAEAVRARLRTADAAIVSDHPFRGHCTLARARRGRAVPVALAGVPVTAGWTVTTVCLVRSTLDPAGARYETLCTATVPS